MKNHTIKVHEITRIMHKMYRCGLVITDFEKSFTDSLLSKKNVSAKFFGDIRDQGNRDLNINLSIKQKTIFEKIRTRYDNAWKNRCCYYLYKQKIEDY
jgi:hypothetical protein